MPRKSTKPWPQVTHLGLRLTDTRRKYTETIMDTLGLEHNQASAAAAVDFALAQAAATQRPGARPAGAGRSEQHEDF